MLFEQLKKKQILKILFFFTWVSLWISINSMPGELAYMSKDIFTFFNGIRTINALFFSFFITVLGILFLIKKDINKNTISITLLLFFIHFISQIIGLLLNEDRLFDLNNTYLVLYSFGTISLIYLIKKLGFDNLIPLFMYFLIFILTISIIYVVWHNIPNLNDALKFYSIYNLIHPDIAINYQAQPRITGFSRSLAVINIFLISIYLINHNKFFYNFYLLPIFFIAIIIWMSQSRGSIICFYLTSAFLIFVFNNLSLLKKIFIFFLITFFSIILSEYLIKYHKTQNESEIFKNDKKELINEELINKELINEELINEELINKETQFLDNFDSLKKSRFNQNNTSGRSQIWKKTLNYYDLTDIFGYGPQSDRVILESLKDRYGNNASNAAIYALISGGYPSLISIILIYLYSSFLILKFFIKKKIYKLPLVITSGNYLLIIAICYCIFFMTRSIIENSFSVFSIDFLITIFSIFIIEKNNEKKI